MGRPLDWIIGLQCKARIDASGALHHIIEHFSKVSCFRAGRRQSLLLGKYFASWRKVGTAL